MSQFGMQMPGGRARRGASLDATTAVLGFAVLALIAACTVMWMAGAKVGKNGTWWELQDPKKIEFKAAPAK